MLQKRLTLLLLLLILLPTLLVGGLAYRFSVANIRDERIKIVGRVAESRHEQLNIVLQRVNGRAKAFLAEVMVKCLKSDTLNQGCAADFLNEYIHTEDADGALIFRHGATDDISVGTIPVSSTELGEFKPDQLAGVSRPSPNRSRSYFIIAADPLFPWRLLVSYPVTLIQPIFVNQPDLGLSGETFLADSDGFFITKARYTSDQGYSHPISARPMQACLSQQSGEILDVDYRGKEVIHGFRFIPEIGGGCIMAHIEQSEAFAPVQTLEKQMLAAIGLFTLFAVLIARTLARRIIGPIVRLTDTARNISNGDLTIRAKVEGHDEISELASSFNQMTNALADAQHNLETKVAERTQALRTSEERYKLAERAVNDGIWDWNILTHEYYLSPRWNIILGYNEGELPNVESIFFELIHPDDKASASDIFRRHLENNERYRAELRLRHKNGSYRWVLDRGEAIRNADGRPVRMVGSITDITERKANEDELQKYREHLEELVAMATTEVKAILQTAVNGVITIDATGAIRTFNPAAEKLFGWTSNEIIGKNVALLMPEPDATSHDGHIQHFLITNQAKILGIEREVVAMRRNGDCFPANLAVGHGILAEGRHMFVGFISDISVQKQVEHELRLAKEAAEAAVKAKASFLANMSHEIRTPMNTVIGFAEVALQDNSLCGETRSHIKTILSSGRHLLGVINDILDFSKIEAGKIALESVCFNLPYAVQEALQTIGLGAAEKGLRIDLSIEDNLPQHFIGDPNRLRQVLLNLVGNAVKFTESGVIAVTISRGESADLLHFAISDTGIGMTTEQTDKIFESFSQADATTSRRFGGTGLGTTISKQIVELMGGRIWVESRLGVGSTFHFTVRLPESPTLENCLYEINPPHPIAYVSPRRFSVLLAEDIEGNATLARLRLEQQCHQVTWVKNGQEAVDAFRKGGYDLILMDLQMPVLDGIDATRQIRQLEQNSNKPIPILALTASVLSNERQLAFAAGIDAIVSKPINIDELLTQMEKLAPKGAGTANTTISRAIQPAMIIDFSPLLTVADWEKALAAWQQPLIYAHALLKFAEQHAADAAKMIQHLNENPENLEAVQRIAHALKGVAGNLALLEIVKLATEIDTAFKSGERQNIIDRISLLDEALAKSVAAIQRLQLPDTLDGVIASKPIDAEMLSALLQRLYIALDMLNPDSAEPIILELTPYLAEADLTAIRREIDGFDFDSAKNVVKQLMDGLAVNLYGV
jgi:PAS domain S-box-containing protein